MSYSIRSFALYGHKEDTFSKLHDKLTKQLIDAACYVQ